MSKRPQSVRPMIRVDICKNFVVDIIGILCWYLPVEGMLINPPKTLNPQLGYYWNPNKEKAGHGYLPRKARFSTAYSVRPHNGLAILSSSDCHPRGT